MEQYQIKKCCASCAWWGWNMFTGSMACFNDASFNYRDTTTDCCSCPEWEVDD